MASGIIWTPEERTRQPQIQTKAALLGVRQPVALINFALPVGCADVVDSGHVLTPAVRENVSKSAGVFRGNHLRALANSDSSVASLVSSNKTSAFNTLLAASGAGSILAVVKTASIAGYGSGNFSPYVTCGASASFFEHYPFTDGLVYMGPLSGSRWISAFNPPSSLANYHVEIVTHTSGAQKLYYDGVLSVSASNVETPSIKADSLFFGGSGLIAVFALWDYILTPGQIAAYAQNPWQLFEADNDPVFYTLGGGGAAALASSVSASGTVSGALTTAIRAAASVSGSASVTAALTTGIPLASSLSGSATVSAALTTAIRLNGSLTGSATVSGDISGAAALASTVSTSAIVTGALTTAIRLNASLSGAATVAGTLTDVAAANFTASISGTATVTASLTGGSSSIWTPVSAASGTWAAQ